MEKAIITAAVTGSLGTRDQNPNIPYTPQEICKAAVESYNAGASIVHLHVREVKTGRPVQDIELFKETISMIRSECDIIINVSTGGGPGMTFDERIAIIPALSAKEGLKPDMASLNAGSLNYGIFSRSKRSFVLDAVQLNPWSELLRFADIMSQHSVKPEIEIYDAGMVNNAMFLQENGALRPPLHFQFVMGIMGGISATVENMIFLKNTIPSGSTWSLCTPGLEIFRLGAAAIAARGNVRVGLEDQVLVAKGKMAKSNAELVESIVDICQAMGREVASPEDARKILNLAE